MNDQLISSEVFVQIMDSFSSALSFSAHPALKAKSKTSAGIRETEGRSAMSGLQMVKHWNMPGGSPEHAWIVAGKKVWNHSALRNAVCLRTKDEFRRFS